MQIKNNVRMVYTRFQTILRQRLRRNEKSIPEISAPFNLKQEPICLPGVSEEEYVMFSAPNLESCQLMDSRIAILREKAAASRIGIAEMLPRSYSETTLAVQPSSPLASVLPHSATIATATLNPSLR
jgi:hypothetical protein